MIGLVPFPVRQVALLREKDLGLTSFRPHYRLSLWMFRCYLLWVVAQTIPRLRMTWRLPPLGRFLMVVTKLYGPV